MIVFLVLLAALCLWKVRFAGFHEDYCAKTPTTAIKGILVFFIFLQHLMGYIHLPQTTLNLAFSKTMYYVGQSSVALFFFYSGYGICESLRLKESYRKTFFTHRFLKTLLHFDLAVLLFVIASFFIRPDFFSHQNYSLKNYLLCWTGWESIGNSNWFMFVILALYLISFSAMCFRGGWMAAKTVLPVILLWVFLYFTHTGQQWWYDTLAAFPLGMLFSQVKPAIDRHLRKPGIWWAVFIGLALAYPLAHYWLHVDKWGVVNCLFCLLAITLSMKVRFDNPALQWLGVNAFAIYILQRLPMNILAFAGVNKHVLLFSICSFSLLLPLAWGFTWMNGRIDQKLFSRG